MHIYRTVMEKLKNASSINHSHKIWSIQSYQRSRFLVIRSVPVVYVKIPTKCNCLISVRCFAAMYFFFVFLWLWLSSLDSSLLFLHEKKNHWQLFFMMLHENIFPLLLENSFNALWIECWCLWKYQKVRFFFLWLVLTYCMLFSMGTELISNMLIKKA